MESGFVVEYIDKQRILCAVVLEVQKQRLRLLTENAREVTVVPTGSERTLRYRDWVEHNRAVVDIDLAPTDAAGEVTFTESGGEVAIVASITGAPPGSHGFHVHEVGDCSSPDFTSAGGHFNPTDMPHGAPSDMERHAGDLGNVEVAEDGTANHEASSSMLTVAAGPSSVVGRGVILHEDPDDMVTQPTGAVKCGGAPQKVMYLTADHLRRTGRLAEADIDWDRVHVLLSDERWVPPDDADSNEKLVRDRLLQDKAADATLLPYYDGDTTIDDRCLDLGSAEIDAAAIPHRAATSLC